MVMITTSNKCGSEDEFWKDSFMLGPIKSPFNIPEFYLCIPISLGAQVKTYVNKTKFWKGIKGECCRHKNLMD